MMDEGESKPADNEISNHEGNDVPKISKNQLKRQRRAEYMQRKRNEKRQKLKEEKQLKKSLASDSNALSSSIPRVIYTAEEKAALKEERERKFQSSCDNNFAVILDCSYESLHLERALKSLCQQIMFCYALNRSHEHPVSLHVTGIGPKSIEQLNKLKYSSWKNVSITDNDFMKLPQFSTSDPSSSSASTTGMTGRPRKLVFLSSDAEDVLEELDPNCAYIIGGIVDRNRYKGMTYRRAIAEGIATAKLPIREYVQLSGTHILTINHVFEILLRYATSKSWPQALEIVLPKRKVVDEVATSESGEEQDEDNASSDRGDDEPILTEDSQLDRINK
jgi:tRNA (guanine9-N1)-methyltransferase